MTDVRPAFQCGGQSLTEGRACRPVGTGRPVYGRGGGTNLVIELNTKEGLALGKQLHLVKRIF